MKPKLLAVAIGAALNHPPRNPMLTDPVLFEKMNLWQEKVRQIQEQAHLVIEERQLRQEVFALAFPTPKEGTNNADLPEGWTLKGTLKIDRKIDEAVLPQVKEQLRALGFNPDPVVKYKPELVTKDYKAMPEEIRKVFDTALTIKPALPTIELAPPKEPK